MDKNLLNINAVKAESTDYVFILEEKSKLNLVSKENNNYVFEGICAKFGVLNDNNRLYKKDEYLPHLTYLNEKILKGKLFGELDHPQTFDLLLKNLSHIVEKLWYDEAENGVRIRIRLLDTPNGKIAKTLVDANVPLSISSRAAGEILQEGIVKLQRIFTYDLVAEPGFAQAVLEPVLNENLKTNYDTITTTLNRIKAESCINELEEISKSYNFNDGIKMYKIDESKKSLFLEALNQEPIKIQNNNIDMKESLTRKEFQEYSQEIKKEIGNINESLEKNHKLLEQFDVLMKTNPETETIEPTELGATNGETTIEPEVLETETVESEKDALIQKVIGYTNFLAKQLEDLVNFTDYLSKMLNQSIGYGENIGVTLNNSINFQNYLSNKINDGINYSEMIGKKVNDGINYSEMIGKKVNEGINYSEMVADTVSNSINYAEHVAKKLNQVIDYSEYIAEQSDKHIDYTNYMANLINNRSFIKGHAVNIKNRDLDKNIASINENKDNKKVSETYKGLTTQIKNMVKKINVDTQESVLEQKYPFLKLLSQEEKSQFYNLDKDIKAKAIATLESAVYFTREDVMGLINSVITHINENIPIYIKFMPEQYKEIYEKMNDSEKNHIELQSKTYDIKTSYHAKTFWDTRDLYGIKERLITEKTVSEKMKKINENQSKEGVVLKEDVNTLVRGYSQDFVDQMIRFADR